MDKLILPADNGKMICSLDDWCKVSIVTSCNADVTGYERREYLFKILLTDLQKNERPVILINQVPHRYICSLSDPYTEIFFSEKNMIFTFIPDKSDVTFSKTDNDVQCVSINDPIILRLSNDNYRMWIKKLRVYAADKKS